MPTFAHQELHTSNLDAAKKFYRSVFGWTYQDMPMPDGVYSMVSDKNGGFGGMSQAQPGVSPTWLGYVGVSSVDDTLAKIAKAGGSVTLPKTEVPGMGWFAWFTDPQGVNLAIWEPAPPPRKKAAKKMPSKPAAKPAKPAAKPAKPAAKPAKPAAKPAKPAAKSAKPAPKSAKPAPKPAKPAPKKRR